MATNTYEGLAGAYAHLWETMATRPDKATDIDATARKIIAKKIFYQAVELQTHVPWFVVGVIHAMESGCDFRTHLHNGDPLTARTKLVPAGRPKTGSPPFTWQDSAVDALAMKNLQAITEWNIERICYELERYNGFGYRNHHPETLSPYLWSGSTHYKCGKYVSDGKWSPTAVSGQSGALPILKQLTALDRSIVIAGSEPHEPDTIEEARIAEPPLVPPHLEFPKTEDAPLPVLQAHASQSPSLLATAAQSKSVWSLINAKLLVAVGGFFGMMKALWDWLTGLLDILPAIVTDVGGDLADLEKVTKWLSMSPEQWAILSASIAVPLLLIAAYRHSRDKQQLPAPQKA